MTRLPLKCLSCDKDVENQMSLRATINAKLKTNIPNSDTLRSSTSKIRRRIRLEKGGV